MKLFRITYVTLSQQTVEVAKASEAESIAEEATREWKEHSHHGEQHTYVVEEVYVRSRHTRERGDCSDEELRAIEEHLQGKLVQMKVEDGPFRMSQLPVSVVERLVAEVRRGRS